MSRRLRPLGVIAAVGVLGLAFSPLASAHTGEISTVVEAGPYRIVVRAIPVSAGANAALAFRSSITNRRTGAAAASALVSVNIREPSGVTRGPYRTTGLAGAYYLILPLADPSGWRALRFSIRVAGSLGTASGLYVPPSLLRQWLFEPWVLGGALISAALFVQGFWRLRGRGRRDHAGWDRLLLFTFGLAALVLPLVSPLDVVGDHFLLSAHMLQHVLIGDLAPALLLVSLRGPLLFFALPRRLLRAVGRSGLVHRAGHLVSKPVVALAIWALAYCGWHVPAAYDYATRIQWVHDLEHASFVIAGFLVWNLLIDPARRGHLTTGERLRIAALLFLIGTVISDTLIFSFRPLYPAYANQVERVFSLGPLRDQQLAGLVMTVDQLLTLGTCTAFLLAPIMRRRRADMRLSARELPA